MIKKLKFKFITFAMVSIAALLVVVLSVINIVNFSLVTGDVDVLLTNIEKDGGVITGMSIVPDGGAPANPDDPGSKGDGETPLENPPEDGSRGGEPFVGPNSQEFQSSIRYFTVTFDEEGVATVKTLNMALENDDAITWAQSLRNKKHGWSELYFRYKVYTIGVDETVYVTVVDYSREMVPTFNVLWASIFGSLGGLAVTFVILLLIGERLVKPYADSDKKQRKFIAEASREMKTPVTVIALQKEILKSEFGENDSTRSIDRQVETLNDLALRLNELIVYDKQTLEKRTADMTAVVQETFEEVAVAMKGRKIEFSSDLAPKVLYFCEEAAIRKAVLEIADNAAKFAKTFVNVKLSVNDSRIVLLVENDTDDFIDGTLDRVFDRFYKEHVESAGKGLGLSVTKAIITDHGGRIKAYKKDGKFVLKIEL